MAMELKSLTNEELRQLEKIYFVLDKKFKGSTVEEKDAFIGEYLQRVERILQSNRNEPTIKQNNYIKSIEAQTGDKFTGRTKFEASEFISFWDYYIRWNDYYNDNLSPDDYINQKKEEYLKKSSYASTTINTKRVKEESLEDRARKGDPQAQHNLGMKLYINGNIEAAEKWYRKAAEQGLSEAQYSLADLSSIML